MHLLELFLLQLASVLTTGYQRTEFDGWYPPIARRPVDVAADVVNDLGVRILQQYATRGNVAFSPTGAAFVLVALYEGTADRGNEQIGETLRLPHDRDVTRIGFRDIHRRLRSYLNADGFLGGLTLSRENTRLRPEYEDVLRFYGFDLAAMQPETNDTDAGPSVAGGETTTVATIVVPGASPTTTTPATTDGETLTSTTDSAMIATTTQEVATEAATTTSPSTTTISPVEIVGTTAPNGGLSDRIVGSTRTTTTEASTMTIADSGTESSAEAATGSTQPTLGTTLESVSATTDSTATITTTPVTITTTSETATASITESSVVSTSEVSTSTASVASTETSEGTGTTSASGETVPTTTETSTNPETIDNLSLSTTTQAITSDADFSTVSSVMEPPSAPAATPTVPDAAMTSAAITETVTSSELTTATESSEVLGSTSVEMTTILAETTDDGSVSNVGTNVVTSDGTIPRSLEGATTTTTTGSTTNPIDPDGSPASDTGAKILSSSIPGESLLGAETTTLPIGEVVVESSTGSVVDESTTPTSLEDVATDVNDLSGRQETTTGRSIGRVRRRRPRNSEGYFYSVPAGGPWLPHHSAWKIYPTSANEATSRDSTEISFLVNGCDVSLVSASTYIAVLPFAYFPSLRAVALEFPLDDPRYNILLLMPTGRSDANRLARDLAGKSLRLLRKHLQPTWVRATIPSFMLRGFVTLTPFIQRLGITDVFEPRVADLSPMTADPGVYARDVQQSIGVNIRNYMSADRTLSRNGLFERAGPVPFTVQHPFLYFIIDAETSATLIAGRVDDPLNARIL